MTVTDSGLCNIRLEMINAARHYREQKQVESNNFSQQEDACKQPIHSYVLKSMHRSPKYPAPQEQANVVAAATATERNRVEPSRWT